MPNQRGGIVRRMTAGGTSGTCSWQLRTLSGSGSVTATISTTLHWFPPNSRTSITNNATKYEDISPEISLAPAAELPHSISICVCLIPSLRQLKRPRGCGTCPLRRHRDESGRCRPCFTSELHTFGTRSISIDVPASDRRLPRPRFPMVGRLRMTAIC